MPQITPDHEDKINFQELLTMVQTCQLRANVAEQAVGSLHYRVERMEQQLANNQEILRKLCEALEKLHADLQEISEP